MAFQIKNFVSIVSSMINHMRGTSTAVTDFNVGSVVRTLVEAPAIEIDELYIQMLNGLIEGIPVAVYQAFDFTRRPAAAASGTVTFSRTNTAQAVTIPSGTGVRAAGTSKTYHTTANASMAIGVASVNVQILADTAGVAGNTLSGTVTEIVNVLAGVDAVTNASAITSGTEEETDDERKARFRAYISTLARGTIAAVEYAAGTATLYAGDVLTEYVRRVGLVEEVPGRVSIYIFNGTGSTSDELVEEAQKIIDGYISGGGAKIAGYRPAGVEITVRKMIEQDVDLACQIALEPGYALDAAMEEAIENAFISYVLSVDAGETLYLSEVYALATTVPGVAGVTLTSPTADIVAGANVALVPGTITIT